MTDDRPPKGEKLERDVLADASRYLLDTFDELTRRYDALMAGDPVKSAEARGEGKQLRDWALVAHQERQKVDEIAARLSPGVRAGEIDFAEARAQIGRRLARLRAAHGAGDVPGGVDGG